MVICPSRIDTDADDFTIIGNTHLTRESLQTDIRFFNKIEEVFLQKVVKNVV